MESQPNQPESSYSSKLLHGLGRLALEIGKGFSYLGPMPVGPWAQAAAKAAEKVKRDFEAFMSDDQDPCECETSDDLSKPRFATNWGFRKRLNKPDLDDLDCLYGDEVYLEDMYEVEPIVLTLTRKDKRDLRDLNAGWFLPIHLIENINRDSLGYREQRHDAT